MLVTSVGRLRDRGRAVPLGLVHEQTAIREPVDRLLVAFPFGRQLGRTPAAVLVADAQRVEGPDLGLKHAGLHRGIIRYHIAGAGPWRACYAIANGPG